MGKTVLDYPAVDFHMHFLPKEYRQGLIDSGRANVDRWPMPPWDEQSTLDYMDFMGIQVGMLTISSPHIHFGDDAAARKLARTLNEAGAKLMQKYPDRFGLMAVLPLPDIEGSLLEMEYALDVLKADGLRFTSNAEGLYLGDPKMDPIFQEMSRRGTIACIHPTLPGCVPNTCQEVPIPAMEFMFDSMRAVANLMFKHVLKRYPGIKFIVPHGGATLSMLVDRFERMCEKSGNVENPPEVFAEIRNLHFDLAAYVLPRMLPALRSYVEVKQLLYGSDFPYMSNDETSMLGENLMKFGGFTNTEKRQILYENACRLFPRLEKIFNKA